MDVFDIVLIDDQTMNVPLSIVSAIEERQRHQSVPSLVTAKES